MPPIVPLRLRGLDLWGNGRIFVPVFIGSKVRKKFIDNICPPYVPERKRGPDLWGKLV